MNHAFAIPQDQSVTIADSANLDAFSRLRVSGSQTLFEVQSQYALEGLRMEAGSTGTGVAPSHSANDRLVTVSVGAGGAGGTSFLQSFAYIPYQPGKSHFIAMTGVMGTAVAGAVKRFGYGDASNGIFYEQNGTDGLQINRRTSTSGGVVNNTVTQANWNIDKMDGSGPSRKTINPSNAFILVIDLQFLGMGRVRVGFDIDGVIWYVHQFLTANVLTVPYMQSATLPVMCEVIAAGAIGSTAALKFKCAQVASEGGFEQDTGRDFSAEGTVSAASGSRTHILSIQPATTFNGIGNRTMIVPESLEILAGLNPVKWELVIGAAFSVAPTWADVNATYSGVRFGVNGTFDNLTSGVVIETGYVSNGTGAARQSDSKDLAIAYPISLNRAGAVRALGTMSLLVTGIGGASDCRAALNWREIR